MGQLTPSALYFPAMVRPRKVIVATAVLLGIACAGWLLHSRWQQFVEERDFRATIPADHYEIALRLLNPGAFWSRPVPKELAVKWGLKRQNGFPTRHDVKDAIRHLESIPDSAPEYKSANELLPYLRALLDKPKEYDAMVRARFESCYAAMRAPIEAENKATGRCVNGIRMPDPKTGECHVMFCGNGIWDGCKPLSDLPMSLNAAMLDNQERVDALEQSRP